MISAVGGAMFTLQVGFMSPSFVGIVPSIEMVIFAAVGGRASLIGAVYGTLLVNYGKTFFSETYPELWLFLMGGLFMAVVMFFPNGIAGLWDKYARKIKFLNKIYEDEKPVAETTATAVNPKEIGAKA
jgi:urea transport system permease protein